MPWTCGACALELNDDVHACPTCGQTKDAWTMLADVTRQMQVTRARARFEVRRGTGAEPLARDDAGNQGYETEVAEVCPVLPKALLLRLVEGGQLPAPRHRLVARVWPRKLERTLTFTIDFSQAEQRELELEGPAAEELEDERFDLELVCVCGPEDVSALDLGALRVIDLSEGDAHAPAVELSAVKKTVELPTELVGPPAVELLEVEDVCFATGRALLLPGGWSFADEVTGLSTVAAALEYARHHPDRRLLLAGHTDPVGSEESNRQLSAERARNVHLYLTGQREAWAAHCAEVDEVRDIQAVLKWIAWVHEWDTDPGAVDGEWGAGSKRARDEFRSRYNREHGGSLVLGAKQSAADWAAIYDLYELELAQKLKTEVARLAELRAALRFTEPPTLACGEAWPTERPGAPADDAAQRRVDVLFFLDSDLPALPGAPPGATIYGPSGYRRAYLTVEDAMKEPAPPYGDAALSELCPLQQVHVGV